MLRELIAAAIFDQRLVDDNAGLCAEEAISRSTLYRLFRRDGDLLNWDRTRRLRDLYRAISDPAETRNLGDVGAAYGFLRQRRTDPRLSSSLRNVAKSGSHDSAQRDEAE